MRGPELAGMCAAVALAVSACGVTADAAAFPAPGNAGGEVPVAQLGGRGEALTALLQTYLRGRYAIRSTRFFAIDGAVPWNAVHKFVASEMRKTNRQSEPAPADEDEIFTAAVYPDGDAGFAVIMARDPLPDGRKLVAYAMLAKTRT